MEINPYKCKARMKNCPTKQCANSMKYGDFCGVHNKGNIIRIDHELPGVNKKAKIEQVYTLITPDNIHELSTSTADNILYNIKHYKLPLNNSKNIQPYQLLNNFLNRLKLYKDNLPLIVYCQSVIRGNRQRYVNKLRGPGFKNRSICVNDEDFYSFDKKENIPGNLYFSYCDTDNYVYCFDIKSFSKLIELNQCNPYNRKDIPKHAVDAYNKLSCYLIRDGVSMSIAPPVLTHEQQFNAKVTSIFQALDCLNYYTNINWFTDLNLTQLKLLYNTIEDIWNYRAQLSQPVKARILQNQQVFSIHKIYIEQWVDKRALQHEILNDINKLITLGESREDKILGGMYVLTGLVEVSQDAANALPWLIQ